MARASAKSGEAELLARGNLTLPAALRNAHNLKPGTRFAVIDLAKQLTRFDNLPLFHSDAQEHARILSGHVDLFDQRDQNIVDPQRSDRFRSDRSRNQTETPR